MDHGIRVASYKRDDWRLLDKVFELKPIKRGDKIPFWQFKILLKLQNIYLSKLQTTTTWPLPLLQTYTLPGNWTI